MGPLFGNVFLRTILDRDAFSSLFSELHLLHTAKPVLETTCIKQSTAVRDHCSDTTTLLQSTKQNLHLKRPLLLLLLGGL